MGAPQGIPPYVNPSNVVEKGVVKADETLRNVWGFSTVINAIDLVIAGIAIPIFKATGMVDVKQSYYLNYLDQRHIGQMVVGLIPVVGNIAVLMWGSGESEFSPNNVPDEVRRDEDAMLELIKKNVNFYDSASEELKQDPFFLRRAIRSNALTFTKLPDNSKTADYLSQALSCARYNPERTSLLLQAIPENKFDEMLRNNNLIANTLQNLGNINSRTTLSAIQKNEKFLKLLISKYLEKERDILDYDHSAMFPHSVNNLMAILNYTPENAQLSGKKIMTYPSLIGRVSDKQEVLRLINQFKFPVNNPNINNPNSLISLLNHLQPDFKNDPEIVLALLKKFPSRSINTELVEKVINVLPDEIKKNSEVNLCLIKKLDMLLRTNDGSFHYSSLPNLYRSINPSLKGNDVFLRQLVTDYPYFLKIVSLENPNLSFKNEVKLVLNYIRWHKEVDPSRSKILEWVGDDVKQDETFLIYLLYRSKFNQNMIRECLIYKPELREHIDRWRRHGPLPRHINSPEEIAQYFKEY